MKKAKVSYDKKVDALYFYLKEGQEESSQEIAPGVSLELDQKGDLLGVEILNASKILGVKPIISEKILESV